MKKTIYFVIICTLPLCFSSCSWFHVFIVNNNTNKVWNISYTTNSNKGIFKNDIIISDNKQDTSMVLSFPDGKVHFSLKPKQSAVIAKGSNTAYSAYQTRTSIDPEMKWIPFTNIDSLVVSNGTFRLAKHGKELDKWLSKNTRPKAVIKLSRLQE